MIISLKAEKLRDIFVGATKNLSNNKALVDSLNVYPVPDGDTGTNMYLTMKTTVNELNSVKNPTMIEMCEALTRGALKGARGNSGVILSQILKGMASVFAEANEITTRTFTRALKNGSKVAYDVVTKPQEGTILTVIRLVSNYAYRISARKNNFIDYFEAILKHGEEVLANTPNQLPVLKKAGVVDAGGKGLLVLLYGMYNELAGIPQDEIQEEVIEFADDSVLEVENIEDIKYAYCTEYFVINLFKKTTMADLDKLRVNLEKIGDCVMVAGDLSMIKVHVHTNNPDIALTHALKLGEIHHPKIENMLEQHREIVKKKQMQIEEEAQQEELEAGIVAICNGEGISNIFKELGANKIIPGGQTMNPSVEDIAEAVDKLNAKTVYILPNNSNIVLAAEQARAIVKKNLIVIPSKNIPQGIAAAMNIDVSLEPEANIEMTRRVMGAVRAGQVTKSVKKTELDGFDLEVGDYIALDRTLVSKGTDLETVTLDLIDKLISADKENSTTISLYYGEGMTREDTQGIQDKLAEKYPFFDIMVYEGGQQHYHFYVSVE
ncbi:MAG: DAK2 domain-containing protein [Christensenellales bacterium]|jgi:DAK2 domain fusion protein YloV